MKLWPFSSPSSRATMPASARSAAALGIPSRKHAARTGKAVPYKGYRIAPSGDGYRTEIDSSEFDTLADAKRFVNQWVKVHKNPGLREFFERVKDGVKQRRVEKRTGKALKKALKRNPASAAVAGYREFHGKAPLEVVTVSKRVHFHEHLSGAGELRALKVAAIDGKHSVTLSGFRGALLAFNERKNQLFIEGGDQAVNLRDFGIDPKGAHELETLGKVTLIDYHTDKRHLGDEGGKATYRHKFRTTNENGKHVTIKVARYPDLIYRVRDKQLEFSGGSYTILAEGIDR